MDDEAGGSRLVVQACGQALARSAGSSSKFMAPATGRKSLPPQPSSPPSKPCPGLPREHTHCLAVLARVDRFQIFLLSEQ